MLWGLGTEAHSEIVWKAVMPMQAHLWQRYEDSVLYLGHEEPVCDTFPRDIPLSGTIDLCHLGLWSY